MDESKGNKMKPFTFNVVFEPEATQEDILEHSGMKRYTDRGRNCAVGLPPPQRDPLNGRKPRLGNKNLFILTYLTLDSKDDFSGQRQ